MSLTKPGSGKPDLVLIHGWGLGPIAWSGVLPALEARFNITSLALPGYTPASPGVALPPKASFDGCAAAFAEAIPADAYVCGWSLGALLALQIARQAPQRVSGLILVGGTASFVQRTGWQAAQPPGLLDDFSAAVEQDAAGALLRFVALINQGDTGARSIGRALNRQLHSTPLADTETLLTGLDWLRTVDLRENIAALETPALLIHGEHDPLMPLAASQWLAAHLRDAQLAVMPGAAHAPFLNDPARFAGLVGAYCHAAARA